MSDTEILEQACIFYLNLVNDFSLKALHWSC